MVERRKTIRLATENYRGRRIYFATLCCLNRRRLFTGETPARQLLDQLIACAALHDFSLHAYCLMPDHLHILVEGKGDSCDLTRFVAEFKQQTAFEYRKRAGLSLWQSRYYDHILRNADDIENVAWYIWTNPIRKGLCTAPQEYPFSGSLTINWKDRCAPARLWAPSWKASGPRLKPGPT
jgi:putative transposase